MRRAGLQSSWGSAACRCRRAHRAGPQKGLPPCEDRTTPSPARGATFPAAAAAGPQAGRAQTRGPLAAMLRILAFIVRGSKAQRDVTRLDREGVCPWLRDWLEWSGCPDSPIPTSALPSLHPPAHTCPSSGII